MLIFSIRGGEIFFQKGKGKYRVTLINSLPVFSVVVLVVLTVFAMVTPDYSQFLAIKPWERMLRILFQINDSLSVVFLYLCVNFHKCAGVLGSKLYGHD